MVQSVPTPVHCLWHYYYTVKKTLNCQNPVSVACTLRDHPTQTHSLKNELQTMNEQTRTTVVLYYSTRRKEQSPFPNDNRPLAFMNMPKSLNSGVLHLTNTQTRATVDDGLTSQHTQNQHTTLGVEPATQEAMTWPVSVTQNRDTTSTSRLGRRTFSQILRTPLQPLSSMRIMQGSARPEVAPCLDTGGRTNQPLFHDDTLDLSLTPNSEVWDWAQTRT